jgi:hypothetical protein
MLSPVQSLWVGPKLSELEILSIKSFQKLGHTFILYTYGKVKNIPPKTIIKDGNKIIKKKDLFKFKKSFLPFSDLFRYKMLYEKGGYWVDLDMIALKPLKFKEPYIFSSERTIQKGPYRNRKFEEIANIGILKAPPKSNFYKELYQRCMDKGGENLKENIQFMRIMRDVLEEFKFEKYVKPAKMFCPLDWWHTKDAFYPPCCKEKYDVEGYTIESVLNKAFTVHMWRSIMYKRHKIDLKSNFSNDSLWEKLKKKVLVSKKTKNKTKKKTSKKTKTI